MVQVYLRAAVLGKFKLYKNVIDDLNLAISSGYPKHLLYKALQRLAVAYTATGQETKAETTYKDLYQALDDAEISAEQRKKMKNDCLNLIKSFPAEKQDKISPTPLELLKLEEPNLNIPSLSSKVRIEQTERRGRFAVAKEDIRAGEVLANERSMVLSVAGVKVRSHCVSCSRSCVAPLPCPHCCSVVFCSPDCRETDLPPHLLECWMSQFVAGQPASSNLFLAPFLLVLRLVLKTDFLFHLNTFQAWQRGETVIGDQTSFSKLLLMVKHFDQLDLLHHVTSCGLIMNMLKCLQYVPNTVNMDGETMMFQIICHYYAAVLSNIHTTSELRNAPNKQVSNTPVAVALFPDVALHINHSCDPNTFVIDIESSQVTIASRNIQAGEEITQVYCGHFGDTNRVARQALLQERYHFQCECQACQQDYPDANTCLERAKTFAETPPSGLKKVLSEEELRELDEKNEESRILTEKALMKGLVPSAVNQTLRRLEMISSNLRSPHILYMMGRVSLINYMCYIYANKALGFTPQKLPVYF